MTQPIDVEENAINQGEKFALRVHQEQPTEEHLGLMAMDETEGAKLVANNDGFCAEPTMFHLTKLDDQTYLCVNDFYVAYLEDGVRLTKTPQQETRVGIEFDAQTKRVSLACGENRLKISIINTNYGTLSVSEGSEMSLELVSGKLVAAN